MIRFALAPVAAVAALASQLAAAKVIEQADGFFVTRDTVTVKASPRAVWLALITPGKWWTDEHTWSGNSDNMSITPQGGGCFCEVIPEKDTLREVGLAGSVAHMTVIQAYPMRVLRMRGGLGPLQSEPVEGIMTITLKEIPAGTQVMMEYVVAGRMRYEVGQIAPKVDEVLSEQLAGLAKLLGPADAPPESDEAVPVAKGERAPEDGDPVEDALDAMDAGRATDKKAAAKPR